MKENEMHEEMWGGRGGGPRGGGRGRGPRRGGWGGPPPEFMRGGPGGLGGLSGAGGRGRGPRVRRGDVRAAALSLLAEGPRNGYQIIQEISERTDGVWRPSPGSVYPALQQLEDEGLIQPETGESGRKAFALTVDGRAYTESHADELAASWDAVTGSVDDGEVQLRQLIRSVMMAVSQVSQAGSAAQVKQAARVLTDTPRALYRILAADEEEETASGPSASEPSSEAGE